MVYIELMIQVLLLYVGGTVAFDVVHYALHKWTRSRWAVRRWAASLHQSHHEFLDTSLEFHRSRERANLWHHMLPEYLTHVAGALVGLFFLNPWAVGLVVLMHTATFVGAVYLRGRDLNHVRFEKLPAPKPSAFVGPRYHALHHVYPNQYMGSMLRLFDWIAGTACPLEDRRVTLTGGSGALGSGFVELLQKSGVKSIRTFRYGVDWTYSDYSKIEQELEQTDILVLAHGAKVENAMAANCDSFVALIERFKKISRKRRFPVEVWAVGSEIESHSHWGNADLKVYKKSKGAYARVARHYYKDDALVYRHICPAAFTSRMGPGLISGRTAARISLFFIRRGFNYIPVTYTGIAFLNYFKFFFGVHAVSPAKTDRTPMVANSALS